MKAMISLYIKKAPVSRIFFVLFSFPSETKVVSFDFSKNLLKVDKNESLSYNQVKIKELFIWELTKEETKYLNYLT